MIIYDARFFMCTRTRSTMDFKQQAKALKPIMQIGKSGLGQGTITLLERELKQKRLVKVKVLRNFLEESKRTAKEIAEELAQFTGSTIVLVVGHTITLHK